MPTLGRGFKNTMILRRTEVEYNPFKWATIEIIAFNFDGKGSALVRFDTVLTLSKICCEDIQKILFGDFNSIFYLPEDNETEIVLD